MITLWWDNELNETVANKKQVANYCFYTHTTPVNTKHSLGLKIYSVKHVSCYGTSQLLWHTDFSYNIQGVRYKVQQQAVHMY